MCNYHYFLLLVKINTFMTEISYRNQYTNLLFTGFCMIGASAIKELNSQQQFINLQSFIVFFSTAQKMKFFIKNLFSKCDQIRQKLRIWSHLLKKSLIENLFFCTVDILQLEMMQIFFFRTKRHQYYCDCWLIRKSSAASIVGVLCAIATHFMSLISFDTPLNLWFSDVFRGYQKRSVT